MTSDIFRICITSIPAAGAIFGFALVATSLFTALLYKWAQGRLQPAIRSRDVHTKPKPRIGGLAMWGAVLLAFIWLQPLLDFGRLPWFGVDRSLIAIVIGMVVILLTGLWDDVKGLSWPWQLGSQFVAATVLVVGGVTISYLRLPFHANLELNPFFSGLFTIVWVMTVINVMNWFDGLDGLAGSIALTASMALYFVSLRLGLEATGMLSLIVAGASAGFLIWNWYPSKLFMGTVGSQLLGFLLAVIAIISGGKVATAVLVLGIPVLDALIVIFRRLKAGQSPFVADQRHLHHRLLKIGLSTPWVVILINGVAALFAVAAVRTQEATVKGLLTLLLGVCMVIFIGITYALERRQEKK